MLYINLGVIAALLLQALPESMVLPTAMGAIALAWSVRDGLSARRLRLRAGKHA